MDLAALTDALVELGAVEDVDGWWSLPDAPPRTIIAVRAMHGGRMHIAAFARRVRPTADRLMAATGSIVIAVELGTLVGIERGYLPHPDERTVPSFHRISRRRLRFVWLGVGLFVLALAGVLLVAATREAPRVPLRASAASGHLPR